MYNRAIPETKTIILSLCGKCAHESVTPLKAVSPKTEKTTCEICGRKRFCVVYEVTK